MAAASDDKTISVHEVNKKKEFKRLKLFKKTKKKKISAKYKLLCVKISESEKYIVTAGFDTNIYIWEIIRD